MIRELENAALYMEFVRSFADDPVFSDPLLLNEKQVQKNLLETDRSPDKHMYGIFENDKIIGLFVFYVIEEEKYMEMLVGLSRLGKAYDEMFDYLNKNYEGYDADFIFNPENYLLRNKLTEKNAEFCEEQQTMYFTHIPLEDNNDVVAYSPEYYQQYCAIHDDDGRYWTGEKTVRAPERFHVYLALKDDKVVGYTDVTYTFDENEPVDLFVKEEYRNQGFGRKLLTRALIDNEPKEMVLQVDVNNALAVHLYESLGFTVKKGRNSITAHWRNI